MTDEVSIFVNIIACLVLFSNVKIKKNLRNSMFWENQINRLNSVTYLFYAGMEKVTHLFLSFLDSVILLKQQFVESKSSQEYEKPSIKHYFINPRESFSQVRV